MTLAVDDINSFFGIPDDLTTDDIDSVSERNGANFFCWDTYRYRDNEIRSKRGYVMSKYSDLLQTKNESSLN